MQQSPFLSIILQGGAFSLLVLLLLFFMSVISWAVICQKWKLLRSSKKIAERFISDIDIYGGLSDIVFRSQNFPSNYYSRELDSANREYSSYQHHKVSLRDLQPKQDFLQRVERSIEKSIVAENLIMEKNLTILATTASSAPFIGLFGTVAGIIDAFYSIGSQGAASIAVVAPGISSALVATAFGLFAAIPALIAHNSLRNTIHVITQHMEKFGFDLINLFSREYYNLSKLKEVEPPITHNQTIEA